MFNLIVYGGRGLGGGREKQEVDCLNEVKGWDDYSREVIISNIFTKGGQTTAIIQGNMVTGMYMSVTSVILIPYMTCTQC